VAGCTRARIEPGRPWILAAANTFHPIQVNGDQSAIRIATTYTGEYHRRERDNASLAPPAVSH
jgi:hypothetical protein